MNAGEKIHPANTIPPFPAVLPHSNSVPYLITHQAVAQELWIRNTLNVL